MVYHLSVIFADNRVVGNLSVVKRDPTIAFGSHEAAVNDDAGREFSVVN